METLLHIDHMLFLLLNTGCANPLFDIVFMHATEAVFWVLPGSVAALLFVFKKKKEAVPVIILAIVTVAITDPVAARVLKPLFGRHRPCYPEFFIEGGRFLCGMKSSLSFPSVHAVNVFAQATVWSVFYPNWKWGYVAFAVFIGYSRIYVGVHYPSDVIAGAITGVAVAAVVLCVYRFSGVMLQRSRNGKNDTENEVARQVTNA
ncbi:MAG: phosphatase PAP2 family protein [Chitinispirillaceae bacterium]|nr:phosphatase PAP2 family protein [Chitinispirillaceae bacterium]